MRVLYHCTELGRDEGMSEYDLIVIGSGPGGFRAAVQASKLRKKVAIVDKHPSKIGGAWIHTGTIPSKTLREVLAAIQSVGPHIGKEWMKWDYSAHPAFPIVPFDKIDKGGT